ncbi:hypothetical protein MNBD_NITROSPINAE02-330 [hydrothermal vent metagenome]|uniref:DNA repair photolyase n=1 Tax=hydrothermal vent metagenome TaxID=652676 RepID=A0A3B1BJH7_9ZZZZ
MDKIAQGFCEVKNPFNQKVERVSLALDDVDGFVFWSRNYSPMIDNLKKLLDLGYRFYCQFTIIGYPGFIDPGSPASAKSAQVAHRLFKEFGPKTVVWRYDPIMLTSVTDASWHIRNFTETLDQMEGATDTCVISFIDKYKKLDRNLFPLLKEHNVEYCNPSFGELESLAAQMREMAKEKGIEVTSCCEPELDSNIIAPTSCVDIARLAHIVGTPHLPTGYAKAPTRTGCRCYQSKDIGAYDTCVLGCAYCYANSSSGRSSQNLKKMEKNSALLAP